MNVAGIQRDLQRRRALGARLVDRIGLAALVFGGAVEQARDGRPDQLDMADLFCADALQQILVGLRRRVAAEVDALEQVLHHRPHFTELATKAFLKCVGSGWIWLVDDDLVDQLLGVQVHDSPSTNLSGMRLYGVAGRFRTAPTAPSDGFDSVLGKGRYRQLLRGLQASRFSGDTRAARMQTSLRSSGSRVNLFRALPMFDADR